MGRKRYVCKITGSDCTKTNDTVSSSVLGKTVLMLRKGYLAETLAFICIREYLQEHFRHSVTHAQSRWYPVSLSMTILAASFLPAVMLGVTEVARVWYICTCFTICPGDGYAAPSKVRMYQKGGGLKFMFYENVWDPRCLGPLTGDWNFYIVLQNTFMKIHHIYCLPY